MDYVSATRKSFIARMALSVSLLLKLLSCLVEHTLEELGNPLINRYSPTLYTISIAMISKSEFRLRGCSISIEFLKYLLELLPSLF